MEQIFSSARIASGPLDCFPGETSIPLTTRICDSSRRSGRQSIPSKKKLEPTVPSTLATGRIATEFLGKKHRSTFISTYFLAHLFWSNDIHQPFYGSNILDHHFFYIYQATPTSCFPFCWRDIWPFDGETNGAPGLVRPQMASPLGTPVEALVTERCPNKVTNNFMKVAMANLIYRIYQSHVGLVYLLNIHGWLIFLWSNIPPQNTANYELGLLSLLPFVCGSHELLKRLRDHPIIR